MNIPSQRSIFRWIHLIFAIPIFGYIYSPFDKLPGYAPPTRFVFFPGPFRIVDVERPCHSTIIFETSGLTRASQSWLSRVARRFLTVARSGSEQKLQLMRNAVKLSAENGALI